jgi:hypothetical protein
MRRMLLVPVIVAGAFSLGACSVSISANETISEPSAEASPNASDSAVINSDFIEFCSLEAKGSLDLIGTLGNDSGASLVADGIEQSIAQQNMTGADAEACAKSWIDTLAKNGLTYDTAAKTLTGELTTSAS